MDGRVCVGVVRMAVVRAIKVEPIEVDGRAFSPRPSARLGNCLQRGAGCSAMTQRVKNHSDQPPSILVWTFRAPIPRPGSVGDRTRGWGARREVPSGAYERLTTEKEVLEPLKPS